MKNGDISNVPAHTLFVNLELAIKQETKLFSKKFSVYLRNCLIINGYFKKDFRVILVSLDPKNRKYRDAIEKTLDDNNVLYNEILYFNSIEDFRQTVRMHDRYTYISDNNVWI